MQVFLGSSDHAIPRRAAPFKPAPYGNGGEHRKEHGLGIDPIVDVHRHPPHIGYGIDSEAHTHLPDVQDGTYNAQEGQKP